MRLPLSLLLSLLSAFAWGQLVDDTGTVATGSVLRVGTSTVVATANRTSCTAPCAVHFDATGTTYPDGTTADKYLALDYRWNFDDPGSGTWAHGARYRGGYAQSRNVEYGFVAAHVFETAGTYDVQLLVSDGNTTSTLATPVTITVTAANTTWATTSTICVAADTTPVAGSGGCPAGASVAQNSDFDTALTTTCNIDSAAVRCLFKGGDTFTSSASVEIANAGPSMIGAYGTGVATVTVVGDNGVIELGATNDFRASDLLVQSDDGTHTNTSGVFYVDSLSGNTPDFVLLQRIEVNEMQTAIATRGDYPEYEPGINMEDSWTMVDVDVHHGSPGPGNDVFIQGDRVAWLGGRIVDHVVDEASPGGNILMRTKYLRKTIIAHSEFGLFDNSATNIWGCSRLAPGSTANETFKIISGYASEAGLTDYTDAWSGELIIADNYVSKCAFNNWDMLIRPTDGGVAKAKEHLEYVVVEGNHFVADKSRATSGSARFIVISNTSHIAVRNNIFDATVAAANGQSHRAVTIQTNADQVGQSGYVAADDVRVYNNTYYQGADSKTSTRILFAQDSTDVTNIAFSNNLLRSSSTSAVLLNPSTSVVCCGGSCNGSCNLDLSSSPFASIPAFPSTLNNFEISPGSAADGFGLDLEGASERDAADRCRVDGAYDIGALERAATECAGP